MTEFGPNRFSFSFFLSVCFTFFHLFLIVFLFVCAFSKFLSFSISFSFLFSFFNVIAIFCFPFFHFSPISFFQKSISKTKKVRTLTCVGPPFPDFGSPLPSFSPCVAYFGVVSFSDSVTISFHFICLFILNSTFIFFHLCFHVLFRSLLFSMCMFSMFFFMFFFSFNSFRFVFFIFLCFSIFHVSFHFFL